MSQQRAPLSAKPVQNPVIGTLVDDKGVMHLRIPHTGFWGWVLKKCGKPEVSDVDIDEKVAFVWTHCDGRLTVGEIAGLMAKCFGEPQSEVEDRLTELVAAMKRYDWVRLR